MTKRKAISKKIRFEVFKRDSFTCQYCGEKAPDVILHVDHIDPVAKGGGKDFGLQTVMDGMDAGFDSYCSAGIDKDSVIQAFSKLGGICHNLKNPDERGIRYARGILRNRLNYVHEGIAISLLREARAAGADDEELKEMAASARNWRSWQDDMHALIQELEG